MIGLNHLNGKYGACERTSVVGCMTETSSESVPQLFIIL
jgi:hypothetical protein